MSITFTTSDPSFWTSPGAGGLGAVLAAILLGLVALYNAHVQKTAAVAALDELKNEHGDQRQEAKDQLAEAARSRVALERHQDMERWWTQYIWATSQGNNLNLEAKYRLATVLTNEAKRLDSKQFIELAQSYTIDVALEKRLQQGR